MAGQQAIHNFLNQPGPSQPGKAAPTQVLPPGPKVSKPSPQQKAQARQVKDLQRAQASRVKDLQRAARDEQRKEDQEQKEQQKRDQQALDAATKGAGLAAKSAGERISGIADKVTGWADSIPTPGGIGILLLIIFLFLWAIVPVNGGNTRLMLLWKTLTGRTRMSSAPEAGGSFDPTQGGGGGIDFGPGTGSGGTNGHNSSATTDLLSQLNIRDFGGLPS